MSSYITHHRVIGAAASALPSHGRGHRFDSYITHHRAARRAAFFVGFVGFPPFRAACRKRVARGVGFGRHAIHGAYTSRQRNINQKVEQDLRGKLGLPATGEIYYVQNRPLYQEYENLVLITYDKWFGYHP